MKKSNRNFPPRSKFSVSLFFLAFSLVLLSPLSVSADTKTDSKTSPTSSLTSEQLAHISSSCSSYRASLKNLQRSDARARTYFGAIYETVSSKYLTPLNLRLVKNNLSQPDLIQAQTSLASLRSDFSTHFISYSKSLEELINLDCRLDPEHFYAQLLTVRKQRRQVATDLQDLNDLISSLPAQITTLTESLPHETE